MGRIQTELGFQGAQLVRKLLVEPRRPVRVSSSPRAHWYAVAAVSLGAVMGQLDASIVNLAYEPIARSFHASLAAASWVGLAYLLAVVALVAPIGRVSDLLGRKLVYVYGFGVFALGSGLSAIAPDLGFLVAFRILQGVGAAMMQASSVAIITLVMPRNRLGRGIGIQGAAQALGLALGPTLGGVLVATGGWHLIFLVNVPVGIAGVVLGRRFVPRSSHLSPGHGFDWPGAALLPVAAGSLLAAISLGGGLGWLSPAEMGLALVAGASTVGLVIRERHAESPVLDLSLFAKRAYSVGISTGLLSYVVAFGTLFAVPLYLVGGLHQGAIAAGVQLTIMPIALGAAAPVAGRLVDRFGSRQLTTGGMALAASGLGLLAAAPATAGLRLLALALVGAGIGMFTPANNTAVMGTVPRASTGAAGGVLNMTRGFGTALGLALTTVLVETFAGARLHAGGYGGSIAAAFRVTTLCLAGVAIVACLLSALRGGDAEAEWSARPRACPTQAQTQAAAASR